MPTAVFVNLPVRDLERASAFYTQLGFATNPQFSDERATCIVMSDTMYVMLLVEEYFASFAHKPIPDATAQSEVIVALAVESRAVADELVQRAVAAGGVETRDPEDLGFMYGRAFQDLDGHLWEAFYMDPDYVEPTT